jgi:hypothetical protein
MPAFVIFVEGADTEPAKVPVYVVESEEHASLICEGMKESEYQIFNFSFTHCTRSDRGKFAVWAKMIEDARKGVYGNIVGGIHDMIDGAYSIMGGRRSCEKIASGADTETGNSGSTTQTKLADDVTKRAGTPPDPSKEKRPAYDRDHLFLQWYDSEGVRTYHSHAKIRDKWKAMTKEEREEIAPKAASNVTRHTVITAVKTAQKERSGT